MFTIAPETPDLRVTIQSANAAQATQRDAQRAPRDRAHHRSSQLPPSAGGVPTTPTAAVVRSPSKRKPTGNGLAIPSPGGMQGLSTPASAVAHVAVPAPSRRASGVPPTASTPVQNSLSPPGQHPYANPSSALDASEYRRAVNGGYTNGMTEPSAREESVAAGYGRGSQAMPGTPAMSSAVRNDGPSTGQNGHLQSDEPKKKTLVDFLLCRCG